MLLTQIHRVLTVDNGRLASVSARSANRTVPLHHGRGQLYAAATSCAQVLTQRSRGDAVVTVLPAMMQISIPEALELLLDAVLNPKLQQWEVEKVAKRLEGDLEAFKQDPHACLLEVALSAKLQRACHRQKTLTTLPAA